MFSESRPKQARREPCEMAPGDEAAPLTDRSTLFICHDESDAAARVTRQALVQHRTISATAPPNHARCSLVRGTSAAAADVAVAAAGAQNALAPGAPTREGRGLLSMAAKATKKEKAVCQSDEQDADEAPVGVRVAGTATPARLCRGSDAGSSSSSLGESGGGSGSGSGGGSSSSSLGEVQAQGSAADACGKSVRRIRRTLPPEVVEARERREVPKLATGDRLVVEDADAADGPPPPKRRRAAVTAHGAGAEGARRGNWVPDWVPPEPGRASGVQLGGAASWRGGGEGPPVWEAEERERKDYAQQERTQSQALRRLPAPSTHPPCTCDLPTVASTQSVLAHCTRPVLSLQALRAAAEEGARRAGASSAATALAAAAAAAAAAGQSGKPIGARPGRRGGEGGSRASRPAAAACAAAGRPPVHLAERAAVEVLIEEAGLWGSLHPATLLQLQPDHVAALVRYVDLPLNPHLSLTPTFTLHSASTQASASASASVSPPTRYADLVDESDAPLSEWVKITQASCLPRRHIPGRVRQSVPPRPPCRTRAPRRRHATTHHHASGRSAQRRHRHRHRPSLRGSYGRVWPSSCFSTTRGGPSGTLPHAAPRTPRRSVPP